MKNHAFRSASNEQFSAIVANSLSYADICRAFNLRAQGSNYGVIKNRICRQHLDISHFETPSIRARFANTIPIDKILVANSSYSSSSGLRKKLIKLGLLIEKCFKCENTGTWQNEALTLQLDHINGDRRDNRLENLRLACPNCHTQTVTHSGKRLKKIYVCPQCSKEFKGYGKLCRSCSAKNHGRAAGNTKFPITKEELQRLIWEKPIGAIAKELGCSMSLVRAKCLDQTINCPSFGYWQRRKAGKTHEASLQKAAPIKYFSRMTAEKAAQIKTLLSSGLSFREIGKKLNIAHTTVSRALSSKISLPGCRP